MDIYREHWPRKWAFFAYMGETRGVNWYIYIYMKSRGGRRTSAGLFYKCTGRVWERKKADFFAGGARADDLMDEGCALFLLQHWYEARIYPLNAFVLSYLIQPVSLYVHIFVCSASVWFEFLPHFLSCVYVWNLKHIRQIKRLLTWKNCVFCVYRENRSEGVYI
jgi:hypothetical protein